MAVKTKRRGKSIYKVINTRAYNDALRRRGDLFVWIDEDVIAN